MRAGQFIGEGAEITVDDIKFFQGEGRGEKELAPDRRERAQGYTLTLKKTKTRSHPFHLKSYKTGGVRCPLRAINRVYGTLEDCGATRKSWIGRRGTRTTVGKKEFEKEIEQIINPGGHLRIPPFTGHSLRRTSVSLLEHAGCEERQIKRRGGWTSEKGFKAYQDGGVAASHGISKALAGLH